MISTEATPSSLDPRFVGWRYISYWTMPDGRQLLIRPIRPADEPLLAEFHRMLSLPTVYSRYAQVLPLDRRTTHERLAERCIVLDEDEIALVAIDLDRSEPHLVAVGRLVKMSNHRAEFAIVVADSYQGAGLGTWMMRQLLEFARDREFRQVIGYINSDNMAMLAVCRKLGFEANWPAAGPTRTAVLTLTPAITPEPARPRPR